MTDLPSLLAEPDTTPSCPATNLPFCHTTLPPSEMVEVALTPGKVTAPLVEPSGIVVLSFSVEEASTTSSTAEAEEEEEERDQSTERVPRGV